MGTFVDIAIDDSRNALDQRARHDAMTAAFAAVDRVASLMSFHDADSDLSRLNAIAGGSIVRVDPWTYDVLTHAQRLFEASAGLFDCTVGASLVESGLLPRHGPVASAREATFADVELLEEDHVFYRRPLCLDLGGIAKGYAVDRAIDALRVHGVESAVVNAGGDLRVLGREPVPIHVRDLDRARFIDAGTLADGAFATSFTAGLASGAWKASSRQAPSAIVDPRARRILDDRRTVSIVAPTCVLADGLTKVLAIAGTCDLAWLAAFDAMPLIH
jgi:thiamine biosynthesis lipoprotein